MPIAAVTPLDDCVDYLWAAYGVDFFNRKKRKRRKTIRDSVCLCVDRDLYEGKAAAISNGVRREMS